MRLPGYHEESRLEHLRHIIELEYAESQAEDGGSFGELLCRELHANGRTFVDLAAYWGITIDTLGELIWDHCKRMAPNPRVRFEQNPSTPAADRAIGE